MNQSLHFKLEKGHWTVNGNKYPEMTGLEKYYFHEMLNEVRIDMKVDFELPPVKSEITTFTPRRVSVIDINDPKFDLPLSQFNKYAI